MMPKNKCSNLPSGDVNKWVNEALIFIEGPEATSRTKSVKSNGLKNQIKPVDHKKAAKKAKQKLKKEERKLLIELNELREEFHGLYFKEFELKNELKECKNNKKQDKKRTLIKETNVKKLKKTKSKIETNILELIGSLKTINSNFKFSYLPTKEEQQQYLQKCLKENKEKLKSKFVATSIQPAPIQLRPNSMSSHLTGSNGSTCFSGPFGSGAINPNLFAPPGFAPMFPTNPNYFTAPVYSNTASEKDAENSKDLSERIVTIRRVYLPDNEAQVTVTAKGNSPEQDKLLYTFVNGQLVPANRISVLNSSKIKNKKNKTQLQQSAYNDMQNGNKKLDEKIIGNKTNSNQQQITINQQKKKIEIPVEINNPPSQNSQCNSNKSYKTKNKKKSHQIFEPEIEICTISDKIDVSNSTKTLEDISVITKSTKKKKSKKKKILTEELTIDTSNSNIDMIYRNQNNFVSNVTDPIQLNFGENDVLTLVKLNGSEDVSTYNNKHQIRQQQQTKFNQTNCNGHNHDCNNPTQFKFNNNLEDLYPAMKNLSLNSSFNDLSNSYYNKSDSPSIMEQLKLGVNVENLKLPPGISLTKVDPTTSQTLRAKQTSIQKLAQPISDISQQNQLPPHQTYAPIYPNIEITPHFMHHDPSGLIMIDTNRNNLFKQQQQNFAQINEGFSRSIPTTYQQHTQSSNIQPLSSKSKKKNKKNKNKQNFSENQNNNSNNNNNNNNATSKIITLKNPMFNSMSTVKPPPGFVQPTSTTNNNDDQPALITKNENGMFTIRNTALQENFLARYPYAGPGGILIPTNAPPGIPTPLSVGNSCNRPNNYTYPHSIPFQESMKDHVCEPNGY